MLDTLVGQVWDVGMFDNLEFDPDKDAIKVLKKSKYDNDNTDLYVILKKENKLVKLIKKIK